MITATNYHEESTYSIPDFRLTQLNLGYEYLKTQLENEEKIGN